MIGVNDITGICIRLPHAVKVDVTEICNIIRKDKLSGGVLIYSPPGCGKTTLLRSIAEELAREGQRRVVVVDSRSELEYGLASPMLYLDILSGYTKATGIEIALRTLNAEFIVCDEIGSGEDITAISDASVGGAMLIASAHSADINSLIKKNNIQRLISAGVFSVFVGISRRKGEYEYKITRIEELKDDVS